MPASFQLALIQMTVVGGRPDLNLGRAESLLAQAVSQGAQVAVLPEALDLGWTHPSARSDAQAIPDGEPCRRLSAAAQKHGLFICAGLTEKAGSHVYNAAVLIDPHGRVLGLHRKLNELEIGHDLYAQGDRLNVFPTPFGTFGLMICADGFAHDRVLSRALGYMGADIILSPSAWAVPADHNPLAEPYGNLWRNVYKPVAREFSLWVAAASSVGPISAGPWLGRLCIGCSLVIDHHGQEILQGPYGVNAECVLQVNVTPEARPTRGCGWEDHWRI